MPQKNEVVPGAIQAFILKEVHELLAREHEKTLKRIRLALVVGMLVMGVLGTMAIHILKITQLNAMNELRKDIAEEVKKVSGRIVFVEQSLLAKAELIQPAGGEVVGREIVYRVKLSNPRSGSFYYVVHGVDALYWPKALLEFKTDRTELTGTTFERGVVPGGSFSVNILEVNEDVHLRIRDWFERKGFDGMKLEGNLLASARLTLRR